MLRTKVHASLKSLLESVLACKVHSLGELDMVHGALHSQVCLEQVHFYPKEPYPSGNIGCNKGKP